MNRIDIYHDQNNVIKNKVIALLRPEGEWKYNEKIELYFKNEKLGIYTILDGYSSEYLENIADHLCWIAYGISKEKLVLKINEYYKKINKKIPKFNWLILKKIK